METEVCNVRSASDRAPIARAAAILRGGGLVAIPTETVYGLAANALDPDAVARIYEAKGRPQDNPLIVHVDSLEMAQGLVTAWPESAGRLAAAFWPGPLTMILPRAAVVPGVVSCGLDTVALRFPSHPVARAVIGACGLPLAAPSANRSGSPSPTCAAHVLADLRGRIEAVLDAGSSAVGVESTVVTLCGAPRLLRPGFVTIEELREQLGAVEVDPAVYHAVESGRPVASPGMKYRHYAPQARVTLVRGPLTAFCRYVAEQKDADCALCFDGEEPLLPVRAVPYGAADDGAAQAARLFEALRTLDELGAKRVYARCPILSGVGMAVYNRLLRAAQFDVVEA